MSALCALSKGQEAMWVTVGISLHPSSEGREWTMEKKAERVGGPTLGSCQRPVREKGPTS